MNRFISQMVSEAAAPVGEMSMRIFKMAMLFFLGMSCLIAGAIFLTIGFFEFLEPLEGFSGAAFGVGGLYFAAALICILVVSREKRGRVRRAESGSMEDTEIQEEIQPAQRALYASNIDKAAAPIAKFLHEAGMERERIAVEAGAEIAKNINPFALVVIATLAGFILSRANRGNFPPR